MLQLEGHTWTVNSITFSPSGELLASGKDKLNEFRFQRQNNKSLGCSEWDPRGLAAWRFLFRMVVNF